MPSPQEIAEITNYFPHLANDPIALEELCEYKKDIEIIAKEEISIPFHNKGKEHAAIVFAQLFECAFNEVKIFARDFTGNISNNVLYTNALTKFLDKEKAQITVVFEDTPNSQSKALAILKGAGEKAKMFIARKGNVREYSTFFEPKAVMHLALANHEHNGFSMYRLETDTRNFIATLNFDNPRFGEQLNRLFDQYLMHDALPLA